MRQNSFRNDNKFLAHPSNTDRKVGRKYFLHIFGEGTGRTGPLLIFLVLDNADAHLRIAGCGRSRRRTGETLGLALPERNTRIFEVGGDAAAVAIFVGEDW